MSKTNVFENEFLALLLTNANLTLVGDATGLRGSSAAGSLFISLHSADPGETGDQTTNEVAYGSYARVGVSRSTGFSVTGATGTNVAAIEFPTGTSGTVTQNATHFGIGTAASGTGKLLYRGSITSPPGGLFTGNGIQPVISASGLTITED
jgi:hypothetical protein